VAKGGALRDCAFYTILFEKVTGLHCQVVRRCLICHQITWLVAEQMTDFGRRELVHCKKET